MAAFDIIPAVLKAFKTVWANRSYLMKLAAVPVAVKLIFFTLAITYAQDNYTHFILIMLPSLLVEGWMLAHFVRFIMLGQTWPYRASGDFDKDLAVLSVRARGVLGGMIVFVLINMVIGLFAEYTARIMMPYMPVEGASQVEIPAHIAFVSFVMLGAMFWGFRLIWLYIPYALNMDGLTYLNAVKGLSTSISMIGTWVLCFIPFMVLMRLAAVLVADPLAATGGSSISMFAMTLLTVLVDTVKGLVTVAAITYGLRELFAKNIQKSPR